MGKSTPAAPAAPDPATTAAAQTASNQQTALYNFGLNNPTVNTPLGSSTFSLSNAGPTYDTTAYDAAMKAWQNGQSTGTSNSNAPLERVYGPQYPGGTALVPQQTPLLPGQSAASASPMPTLSQFETSAGGNPTSTQTITLNPQEQQLLNQQEQQQVGLSDLASQLQGSVNNSLSNPLPTYSDLQDAAKQAQDAYYNNQMAYIQPQETTAQNQLNSQLANQGVMAGSDAYNTAQDAMARQNTFTNQQAQNNAILQGPQNAQQNFALDVAAQNQPLNQLSALMSQSQVSMPNFQSVNTSASQPTNVAQLYQNQYAGATNAYNQGIASNNASTTGLFGLGGAIGAGYAGSATGSAQIGSGLSSIGTFLGGLSDIRLKDNITHTGYEKGFPIYHFAYKADPEHRIYRGVMAQDVQLTRPDAIVPMGDYMAVDYGKIGIEFGRVH